MHEPNIPKLKTLQWNAATVEVCFFHIIGQIIDEINEFEVKVSAIYIQQDRSLRFCCRWSEDSAGYKGDVSFIQHPPSLTSMRHHSNVELLAKPEFSAHLNDIMLSHCITVHYLQSEWTGSSWRKKTTKTFAWGQIQFCTSTLQSHSKLENHQKCVWR